MIIFAQTQSLRNYRSPRNTVARTLDDGALLIRQRIRERELWAINKTQRCPRPNCEETLVGNGERAKRFRNRDQQEGNESHAA